MPLSKGGYSALELKELLTEHLRHKTIENFCASAQSPEAMYRRIHDIMHDKCQRVSLRVADEICINAGHPEWLGRL